LTESRIALDSLAFPQFRTEKWNPLF